jgi:tetratricopeptide (TPR) repeat protein
LFEKALLRYRGVIGVLKLNGPPDEPDANLQIGEILAETGNLRQAATLFTRRLELIPNDPEAELDMAKTYADRGKLDKVTELVHKLHANPTINHWELTRVQSMAYLAVGSNAAAQLLLEKAIKEDPTDQRRVGTLADLYLRVGYEAFHRSQTSYARACFNAALTNFDQQVKLLSAARRSSGDDANMTPTLLKKAEMQVMLGRLGPAIGTLSQILQMQPDNTTALLNRGAAEAQLKRITEAKADYEALARLLPQQRYVVDYHMADIALLENNLQEEISCLKRYLNNAPEETPEYASAQKRLQALENQ